MKTENDESRIINMAIELWSIHWLEIVLLSSFVVVMLFITLLIIFAPTPVEIYEHVYRDCIATERHTEQECHEIALFDVADD